MSTRPLIPLLLGAALFALAACPEVEPARDCQSSVGCGEGEICHELRCRTACPTPAVECPEAFSCQHGVCLPAVAAPTPDAGAEDANTSDSASDDASSADHSGVEAAPVDTAVADTRHPADSAVDSSSGGGCTPNDDFEPNDEMASAALLETPTTIDAISCSSADIDWYSFTAPARSTVTVTLDFFGSDPDLDLALYDAADPSFPLAASSGTESTEEVTHSVGDATQDLLVEVENWWGDGVAYTLTILFVTAP